MTFSISSNDSRFATIIPNLVLASVIAILTGSVFAEAGRYEINDACASSGGCFAGDSPGYPVEIAESGSYVLTSQLDVPAGSDGLALSIGSVTIDFNGFAVIGPETCNNTPVTDCTGSGFERGINATQPNITVKDGRVKGFPGSGILLGDRATVTGFRAEQNGSSGIFVGTDSLIAASQAARNGISGIVASDRSVVRDANAWGNGNHGIDTGRFSVVADSIASENADRGISTLTGNTVRGVSVTDNGGVGILLFNGTGMVTDSTVTDNADFGVRCSFGGGSGLDNVVLNFNNSGNDQWDGICNDLGGNLCQSSATCP